MEDLQKKVLNLEELLKKEVGLDCTVTVQDDKKSLLITYKDLSTRQQKFITSLNDQFKDIFVYYVCKNSDYGQSAREFSDSYSDD
ncbi:MAG: hypothetical protein AABW56_00435 [Nanoarchaeota archaeon]